MLPTFIMLPDTLQPTFLKARLILWCGLLIGGVFFSLSILFPTITQSFDFNNPGASKNQIVDPRTSDAVSLASGKVSASSALVANTSLLGDFSAASLSFTLEDRSAFPETVTGTLRRGYRAAMLPIGGIATLPTDTLYSIQGVHYRFQDNTLYPFISEAAYASRYPVNFPVLTLDTVPAAWSISNEPIGFRVGSLVSFADGVFIVTSETEIRPVGSAEIFLALGYRFDDVKPVSEEELGIYKRGRIILLNTMHSDGTLFRDLDGGRVFVKQGASLQEISDTAYRAFLTAEQTPIDVRLSDNAESVTCTLSAGLFPRTYHCEVELAPLNDHTGFDYEISLHQNDSEYELESLSVSFRTHVTVENARVLLAKVKQRILTRFGIGS